MSSGSQTPSQALLSAPLLSSVDDEACCELVGDHLRPGAVVFFITITQSPTARLSVYREYGPDDIDVRFELVAVDNQNTATELDENAVREAGEDVTITTIRNARDLTRLGLAINKRLREIDDEQPIVVCFHSLTSLLQFVDQDIAFRFIHTLNGVVESYNGSIHYHIDANAHSPEVMGTFRPLFDTVVDGDDLIRTKRDLEKVQETTQRPPAIELEPSTDAEGRGTEPASASSSDAADSSDAFDDTASFALDVEEVSEPIGDSTATEADPTIEAETGNDPEFDTVFDPDSTTSTADVEPAGGAEDSSASPTDTESAEASTASTTSPDTEATQSTPGSEPLPTDSAAFGDIESSETDTASAHRRNKPLPELDTASTTTVSEPAPAYDSAIGETEARELLRTDRHRAAEGSARPVVIGNTDVTDTVSEAETVADSTSPDTLDEWEWADTKPDPNANASASTDSASAPQPTERVDASRPDRDEQTATTATTTTAEQEHSGALDRSGTEVQSAAEAASDKRATITIDVGFIAQTVLGVLLLIGGFALLLQGEALLAGLGVSITAVFPAAVSLTLVGGVIAGLGVLILFLR